MYEDIKIKLNPYLGCSKNLMEIFAIIGYEEESLNELAPNIVDNKSLNLSIISSVISDLSFNIFDPHEIIKKIYPDKPKIRTGESHIKFKTSNVVFSSCFDSIDGTKKLFYSCYALRFYENFIDIYKNHYYVPKAILILSQYPYYTTFNSICSKFLIYNESERIPIEILIHCYINYIPSPIKNNLILKDLSSNIYIPKLTAYPYADYDICKIFNLIPIKEFIKIYILIFLELDLLIFSPNIEKLNIFLHILYILNYPLTDSNYFWHIKSISIKDIDTDESINTTYKGVNFEYNNQINLSRQKYLHFIIDMEDKKKDFIKKIKSNDEAENINQLLIYINKIFSKKKKNLNSVFLLDTLTTLENKLNLILKEYTSQKHINESFFYVDQNIIQINRLIQEAFYDFILNILVILNKDFEIDSTLKESIKKREYYNPKLSEEEKIFINFSRDTIKYNTYFDKFIKRFDAQNELKVSCLFSDEYVNLKMKDINKNIPEHIRYFSIMDKQYSWKPKDEEINYNSLYNEFISINKKYKISKYPKEKKNQLFALEENLIKLFIFHKKNRESYQDLNKEEKIEVETIDKMSIPLTIQNYFYKVLKQEFYLRSSLVYIFSMIFPLLSFQDSLYFLKEILKGLTKIQYFQRYYLYILLKSINKYYVNNQKNCQFPQFITNNEAKYCQLIFDHLMDNDIAPNEEIYLFLKKILVEKDKINQNVNNNIENKDNKYFVFVNKENDFEKNINKNPVIIDCKNLIFSFKGVTIKKEVLTNSYFILQKIYSIYDDYFNIFNFNLEDLNIEELSVVIINFIFYFYREEYKYIEMADFLTNLIILLNNLEKDLNDFKEKRNKNNNQNNNQEIVKKEENEEKK